MLIIVLHLVFYADKSTRFLLARLHMDSLLQKFTARQVREALKEFPQGMNATYDEAMARIEQQTAERSQLAKRVLSWITYAFKPLSVEEIQHALAVELETTCLDFDNIIDEETLTAVCAGLVVIDKQRPIIRLVRE